MLIRHADPDRDAAACAAVYAPYIEGGAVTSFELAAPDAAEMARRIAGLSATHAWLIAEREGEIAGYAYAGPHRPREAYRWSAEVSIYLAAAHHRQGVGRALYEALLGLLRRQRLQVALAGITLPNAGSVGLHESFGFRQVAAYPNIGWKDGGWREVGWWQLTLQPGGIQGGSEPPPEPLGPQRLS